MSAFAAYNCHLTRLTVASDKVQIGNEVETAKEWGVHRGLVRKVGISNRMGLRVQP